jgi:TRAP transporter 4TM/12TM fusion protein
MAVIAELTRRAMGMALALLAVLAVAYCLFGRDLPWIFRHAGAPPDLTARTLWYSLDGVFGLAASVMVGLIYIYIVFGAVLEGTGASAVLLRFATGATSRLRGGPAHGAVLASAMFGTMSGSAAANVVSIGVFTIPTIKRHGFGADFAAGVEAAGSTGGQILPPVMGAAAFMMAELTGTPYVVICVAALLPALFYYGSLFCSIAVMSKQLGIERVPAAERRGLSARDWVEALLFLGPVATIIFVMAIGRSAAMAGFWAIVVAILVALAINPEVRRRPLVLLEALAKGGIAGAKMTIAVAAIGVLIGATNLTGIGMRFSNIILDIGQGNLFLSLVMTMIASLFLGMGLPTLPSYLIIVLVIGPALVKLGVPLLIAHLFVFYYSCLSAITPPVAIAAYGAAAIADTNPITTGFTAIRIALVGFLIPFVFVYEPSLTLIVNFDIVEFVWAVVRLSAAIWLLTTGFVGVDSGRLALGLRALRLVVGVLVLVPLVPVAIAAAVLAAGLMLLDARRGRLQPAL